MTSPANGRLSTLRFGWWAVLLVCGGVGQAEDPCAIDWVAVVPPVPIGPDVMLGGLSDLSLVSDGDGERLIFWALTDRGPNGSADVGGGKKMRTILSPQYAPTLMKLAVVPEKTNQPASAAAGNALPLTGRSGLPLSGRPNGIGRDEPILDASGGKPIPPDPNGVDTEGIVALRDGTFWMVEEYRPSLLRVSSAGRVLERYVPQGTRLEGADAEIRDVLPAAYSARRDNRGFESLAVSPDGSRLWAMLQSPLENGKTKHVSKAGNVRLLAFDPVAMKPVAEHVYRLGDPADRHYLTKGAAPNDGKLCAMAAIDADSLLVIEQDDTGLARLYCADLADATDTLPLERGKNEPTLEEIRDLQAAGIRPARKVLVADLTPLVPQLRRDVFGDEKKSSKAPLKLEGLAILDRERVAIVNDNDFGVHVPAGTPCRTCIWAIRLADPLPQAGAARSAETR